MTASEKILEKEIEYAKENGRENPIDHEAFRKIILDILREAGHDNVDLDNPDTLSYTIVYRAQVAYYRWLEKNRDKIGKEKIGGVAFRISDMDSYEDKIAFLAEEVQDSLTEIAVSNNEPDIFTNKKTQAMVLKVLENKIIENRFFITYLYPEKSKSSDMAQLAKQYYDEWLSYNHDKFRYNAARELGRGFLSGFLSGLKGR